jgi:DNA-binding MarR family transcriptional regulator
VISTHPLDAAAPPVAVAAPEEHADPVTRVLTAVRRVKMLWTDVSRSAFPAGSSGLGVLHLLDQEGPQRVSDLAACAHVGVSTMSRHVTDLAAAGLLDRELDPNDGRTHLLRLTPAGAAELTRARAAVVDRVSPAVAGWTAAELDALVAQLDRLADDIAACCSTPERTSVRT